MKNFVFFLAPSIFTSSALAQGSYSLQAIFNGTIYSETIIKP